MNCLRALATVAITFLMIGGLAAASAHPETWPQVLGLVAPTIATLAVLLQVHSYQLHINSRMDQLLDLTARASRAEGVQEEREHPGGKGK